MLKTVCLTSSSVPLILAPAAPLWPPPPNCWQIAEASSGGKVRREEDILVSNTRHIQLLKNALGEVNEALSMTRAGEAIDFIEVNANAAFGYLGEITGDTASGEIIDEVFARFCLGK